MAGDLKKRTFYLAVSVGELIGLLPNTAVNKPYFTQLVRCSSSVGANYRASQRAKSGRDFLNKLKIVEEEADETIYFLELLIALNKDQAPLIQPVINEATEILKMIVSSIKTFKNKHNDI
jgi:four helix bundle protein